jgi:hypothetical protein
MNGDWFWEGNVQASIARFLEAGGWTVRSAADTATKAHGVDLIASVGKRTLALEVKGYPSSRYADPRRAHETKPTNPVNQAAHWFAQAILKAMRLRSSMLEAETAIGLPDFPRYRNLLRETEDSLRLLSIGVYLVSEGAEASMLIPHRPRQARLDEHLLPFDGYEGAGRRLMGPRPVGGGSSRRGYGVPVFEQCGWACAYCGVDLADSYELWLGLSVDHVVPSSLVAKGYPKEWIEDVANKVTCCRHCNEFLNQFRVTGDQPSTLEAFFDLRDRTFREKRKWVLQRHVAEREWYDRWRGSRPGS